MKKFTESTEVSEGSETEHSETLKALDKQAIEDPVLVNTVQERLDNLNSLTSDEDLNKLGSKTAVSEEESDGSTPESEDGSEPEGDGQAELEEKPDGTTPEAEEKGGEVKIPDSYLRAALHHGLNEKDVDDMVRDNPKSAMKLLESCYLSVNNASREWSELGRAKIEAERVKTVSAVVETVVQEDPKTKALIAKLRKEYTDDPLIEVVIEGLENKAKPIQQTVSVPQAQQNYEVATARANAAGNLAIDQRVNSFFGANTMKPYEKFYGKLELGQIPEDLSNGQQLNRLSVLQEAEFIIAGHNSRGQKIEVEQALEKAHFIVTEPIRQQVIRDNLKATATKRKKSMTLRPSDSKRSGDSMRTESSKPRNKAELELAVQQKLDSVFKK